MDLAEKSNDGPAPSPARFAGEILMDAARTSDLVARVSRTLFAVLLIEAESQRARQFTERVRTRIGSSPFARHEDGTGVYARAWAGVASWDASLDSAGAYAAAAERSLASTFRGYEAAQEWFKSEGMNKPIAV